MMEDTMKQRYWNTIFVVAIAVLLIWNLNLHLHSVLSPTTSGLQIQINNLSKVVDSRAKETHCHEGIISHLAYHRDTLDNSLYGVNKEDC